MPEVREVNTQMVDQRCPVCNNGWMRPSGIVKPTNPPSFEHTCTSCGHKQEYGVRFPYAV